MKYFSKKTSNTSSYFLPLLVKRCSFDIVNKICRILRVAFPSIYAFDARQVSRYVHYRRALITSSCFSNKTEGDLIMMRTRAHCPSRRKRIFTIMVRIVKTLSSLPRRAANVSCRYGKYEIISRIRTEITRRCRNLRSAGDKPRDLALRHGNR